MYALVRAMVRTARRLGVEIRTSTAVRQLILDRDRVVGVRLEDGSRVDAPGGGCATRTWPTWWRTWRPRGPRGLSATSAPSMSGWVGILKGAPAGRGWPHTVLFPDRYLDEFADLFDRNAVPTDPTVYLCTQSLAHHRRGWPDHDPVFVMSNAPPIPADGPAPDHRGLTPRMWDRLAAAGLIEAGDELVWQRSPAALAARFPRSRGALYGASSKQPARRLRPSAQPRPGGCGACTSPRAAPTPAVGCRCASLSGASGGQRRRTPAGPDPGRQSRMILWGLAPRAGDAARRWRTPPSWRCTRPAPAPARCWAEPGAPPPAGPGSALCRRRRCCRARPARCSWTPSPLVRTRGPEAFVAALDVPSSPASLPPRATDGASSWIRGRSASATIRADRR